jgi:hypothetical protein
MITFVSETVNSSGVTTPLPSGVRLKYRHWYFKMPWMKPYRGMVVGKTIIFREGPEGISKELLAHELIHIEQMNRYGRLGFYFRYLAIYFRNLLRYRSSRKAYLEHPFEIEAREKSGH